MKTHTFSTPMMQQYAAIKEKHADCLLFFRLGDFYELFMDDAKIGADVLDITLTKRPRGKDGHIPMAGVPYHVADIYIGRLVKAGHKVAICEQVSEPDGKGIVEREVVRIVTPGTLLDEQSLDKREFNYVTCITLEKDSIGFANADLSTGDFKATQFSRNQSLSTIIKDEVARFNPKEIILEEEMYQNKEILKIITQIKDVNIYNIASKETNPHYVARHLKKHFDIRNLAVFGLDDKPLAQRASLNLLQYLEDTQLSKIVHIRRILTYEPQKSLILDASTIKNLELFETIHERKKTQTLVSLLDTTTTAMGARKLRDWIKNPLVHKSHIDKRLDAVEYLTKNSDDIDSLNSHFTQIYDVKRILSRLSIGVGNPVDVIHLKESLSEILEVKGLTANFKSPYFQKASKNIRPGLKKIITHIDNTLVDNPPFDMKSGGLIKPSVSKQLDSLREKIQGSKTWLAQLEDKERTLSGISNLKVRYNKVFGFYIEISKANANDVPDRYIRKQTLVSAERFITEELKTHEEKVLAAEETIHELEYTLFLELIESILEYIDHIQSASETIATFDVITSFAQVSYRNKYTRPHITMNSEIAIINGQHPVVADVLQSEFVPNSIKLGDKNSHLALITGPNMAGKSVFIRQVALITLMAHIGMFVPAESAKISIVDRIFVRSGESDVITEGLSTFMLEMIETAHILHHATDKSLIVMDEVGRGTSTYDGISIAWAIVTYIVTHASVSAKTLFATHYHELTELEKVYPKKIANYSMSVEEKDDQPLFLYTLSRGPAPTSFGIQVAQLAGIPDEVIQSAKEKLHQLEFGKRDKVGTSNTESLADIMKILRSIDLNETTPLEALKILDSLITKIQVQHK